MTNGAIPSVKFADPELMRKLTGVVPQVPMPQPQQETNTFQFDTMDAFAPDTKQQEAQIPVMPQIQMPATQPQQTPVAQNTTTDSAVNQAQQQAKPPVDSANTSFAAAYLGHTPKQREIIDAMAKAIEFKDLFTKKRFTLDWIVIEGKLKIYMESMNQQELINFWEELNDVKGSTYYLDAVLAHRYCVKVIKGINGKMLPKEDDAREELLKSMDHTFIQLMFDYAKLFEMARMKVLHSGDFIQNPT